MNQLHSQFKSRSGLIPVLLGTFLASFVAGCGGGLDPISGNPGAGVAPTITATVPMASTPVVTGVATNSRVTATFSKQMAAATITSSSFSLTCPQGTPVVATVGYDAATQVATLTPSAPLPPSSLCAATITTAAQDTLGFALASNFVWGFVTAPADLTRPTVIFTVPAANATNVASNARVSVTFSEDMNPTTLSASSFTVVNTTLGGAAVSGTVSYSVAARTATFTPLTPSALAGDGQFTATITTAATDLAGNALAGTAAALPGPSNYVWSFQTSNLPDTTAPRVTALNPPDITNGVCRTTVVSATFSEPMDPATINSTTFVVKNGGVVVAGSLSYDALGRVASFVPANATGFASEQSYIVTVFSGSAGVKDLAGNALAIDELWVFTTGTQSCRTAVNLRTAASFGAFGGGAGVTNQGINTVVNANLGSTAACTLVTGFHDAANVYTQTPLNVGAVNGGVYCAPPAPGTTATLAIATQARADALSAYNELAAMPAGSDPGAGQLGGRVLPAAVYTAASGTFAITTGDLTLDGQGNSNAVWVFQSASALTVGLSATPRRVLLINGARASNVFWQVGSAGRIEDGSTMVGTIIAPAGVTISTPGQTLQTTLTGRAISLTASVTMVNTTIVAP